MNTAAKGRQREHKSRDMLEAAGYRVTRAAGSMGCWDLVGISATDVVLVQVKSNRPPSPAEREELSMFPCPSNARRLIHVWKDRARWPIVTEL